MLCHWVIPYESNDPFPFWVKKSRLWLLDPWRQKCYNHFKSCKLPTQQNSDTCSLCYTFLHSCYCTLLGSKYFPQCMYLVGFTLSQATKALRESRGIALLYFRPLHKSGRGVRVTPRQHLTPGKDPVPIRQEAGWTSGLVLTGAENLAPPGFDPRNV